MKKIFIVGEALVDWVCLDRTLNLNNAKEFIKAAGGAPANVAVGLAKRNYPVSFIGGFSTDAFGKWLKEYITAYGVDTSHSQMIDNANTRNAYVLTDEKGNRVFKGFSNFSCADTMLDEDKIDYNTLINSPILYFGSMLQSDKNSRGVILRLITEMKEKTLIVYDPNFRLDVWHDKATALAIISHTLSLVDVIKLSDDEIVLLTGKQDIAESAEILFKKYNPKLLIVTMGQEGCYYINKNHKGYQKSFTVEPIEATGAGDAFVSGVLSGLYDLMNQGFKVDDLNKEQIETILVNSSAIGALATTKAGAMTGLPSQEELDNFLAKHQ